MPEIVMEVGKRIQSIMKQKKLKRRDVAYNADLELESFRRYIVGAHEMKIGVLIRIAKALDVDPADLIKKK